MVCVMAGPDEQRFNSQRYKAGEDSFRPFHFRSSSNYSATFRSFDRALFF